MAGIVTGVNPPCHLRLDETQPAAVGIAWTSLYSPTLTLLLVCALTCFGVCCSALFADLLWRALLGRQRRVTVGESCPTRVESGEQVVKSCLAATPILATHTLTATLVTALARAAPLVFLVPGLASRGGTPNATSTRPGGVPPCRPAPGQRLAPARGTPATSFMGPQPALYQGPQHSFNHWRQGRSDRSAGDQFCSQRSSVAALGHRRPLTDRRVDSPFICS